MEFYISPDRRQELERKLEKMFKHLEQKPEVKIGMAEQVIQEFIEDYGSEGHSRRRYKIQACHVEIEDIKTGDWILVATVAYDINSLLMCDSRYFKQIPEQYGLQYTKCDHCGSIHKNRKESHILYNPSKDEWLQVGSTCVNKMLNGGKYLNKLMVQLYNVIKCYGGCDDDEWFGGGWRPSNKYKMEAVRFDDAMAVVEEYKKKEGHDVWFKPEYDDRGRKIADGTNDGLMHLFGKMMSEENVPTVDAELFSKVKAYYDIIPYGDYNYDPDGWEPEKTLTQKIKDAFENEFILLYEMYLAWFAIANYKKHLLTADFAELVKSKGVEKGMKLDICGKLLSCNYVHDEYAVGYMPSYWYETSWQDQTTGLIFKKNISQKDVIEPFLCEDGLYRFNADVKYIALKGCYVGLSGRLRKQKKVKYVEPQN